MRKTVNIGYNVENMTINMSGGTLVQHADLVQASGEVIVEKPSETDKAALLPQEGDYQAVVKWLQLEKEKGVDYYAQAQFNRSRMCRQLSNIFGWIVNENSLRKAQNSN